MPVHSNQVNDAQSLHDYCLTLGDKYNPANDNLALVNVQTLITQCKNCVEALNTAIGVTKNQKAQRVVLFKSARALMPRINGVADSSKLTDVEKDQVHNATRLIQGRRASDLYTEQEIKDAAAKGETLQNISSTHVDFDNIVGNVKALVGILQAMPNYITNIAELQVPALQGLAGQLDLSNTTTKAAEDAETQLREQRDTFYWLDLFVGLDITKEIAEIIIEKKLI